MRLFYNSIWKREWVNIVPTPKKRPGVCVHSKCSSSFYVWYVCACLSHAEKPGIGCVEVGKRPASHTKTWIETEFLMQTRAVCTMRPKRKHCAVHGEQRRRGYVHVCMYQRWGYATTWRSNRVCLCVCDCAAGAYSNRIITNQTKPSITGPAPVPSS